MKSGDKILFIQNDRGDVVINNASSQAIYKAQKAFTGVAEEIGVPMKMMSKQWLMKSDMEGKHNENTHRNKCTFLCAFISGFETVQGVIVIR